MSPKNDDDIRKLILERRARFLAAALTTTGLHACTDSGPSVCLSIAMTPTPSGTATIGGTDATHTSSTTSSTTQTVNSCHNPPACVCLSIAVTQPPLPTTAGPETIDPGVTMTSPTALSSDTQNPFPVDAGSAEAGSPDAARDAGVADAGSTGSTVPESSTTVATTTEFSEPTVCLEIVEFKRK